MSDLSEALQEGASKVGDFVGSITGANREAEAAQAIAEEQLAEARKTQELATAAAAPSMGELEAINRLIGVNQTNIERQQNLIERETRLLQASDPALIEAANQALALLKGEEAASIGPLRAEREKQRNDLRQRLVSQIGPGAETSSAGIEALNAFDNQTASILSQTQQQTLGSFLGVAQDISTTVPQVTTQAGAVLGGDIGREIGAQQNIVSRKVSAITGTAPAIIETAGASSFGELIKGQRQQEFAGEITGAATQSLFGTA